MSSSSAGRPASAAGTGHTLGGARAPLSPLFDPTRSPANRRKLRSALALRLLARLARPGQGGCGASPTHARTLGDFVHAPRARTARPPSPHHRRRHHSPACWGLGPGGGGALCPAALPTTPVLCLPTVSHPGQGPGEREDWFPQNSGPEKPQGPPASSIVPCLEPSQRCEGTQATAKAMAR